MEPPIRATDNEVNARSEILNALNTFNDKEKLMNLGLFIEPRLMSKLLFLNFVYQKILPIQGVILDLGTHFGQNSIVFETLRAIYEPYNYQRKIVAFDTFTGFCGALSIDGPMAASNGHYATDLDYPQQLESLLAAHELLHPLHHIKKHQVVQGDVTETLPAYIKQHPETIISLAYFDMDLYNPTVSALNAIKDRLTIGSVCVFDELNYSETPGETLALMHALGLQNVSVKRFPFCSKVSYIEIT